MIFSKVGQPDFRYQIDKSLSDEIDSLTSSNKTTDTLLNSLGYRKPEFMFRITKAPNLEDFIVENASDLAFAFQAQELYQKGYVNASIFDCYLKEDTIIVQGGLGYIGAVVFTTKIYKNKSNTEISLITAQDLYSFDINANNVMNEIQLKVTEQKLVLTKQPNFTVGKRIKAKAHLILEPFYQKSNNREMIKMEIEFDIVFDTEIDAQEHF